MSDETFQDQLELNDLRDLADELNMVPRMRIFADEWLTGAKTGKQFNATAAYEFAGYKRSEANPATNASKLLRHPKVQAYIKAHMENLMMSVDEVSLRFAQLARSQVGDFIKISPHGEIVIDHEKLAKDGKHLIKGVGLDSNGNTKLEFHDSYKALQDVARIQGMFKDQMLLGGAVGGGPLKVEIEFVESNDEELEEQNGDNTVPEDFSEFDEE